MHAETLSFLYETLDKFNYRRISKKTGQRVKAFSYFQTVAKNFLVQKSMNKKKEKNVIIDTSKELDEHNEDKPIEKLEIVSNESTTDIEELREFMKVLVNYLEKNIEEYKTKDEKKIVNAIIYFINNTNDINIYNKKHLYLYLREYTGLTNKKISDILMKLKKDYIKIKKSYYNNEI